MTDVCSIAETMKKYIKCLKKKQNFKSDRHPQIHRHHIYTYEHMYVNKYISKTMTNVTKKTNGKRELIENIG